MAVHDSALELPAEFGFLADDPDFTPTTAQSQLEALTEVAQICMELYFADKQFHCGGPIPHTKLYSRLHVEMVRNCSFDKGVELCYEVLADNHKNILDPHWDIEMFICALETVQSYSIPKRFQIGIILLDFLFCQGYKFPQNYRELCCRSDEEVLKELDVKE